MESPAVTNRNEGEWVCLLSVKYRGECKIISIKQNSLYADIHSELVGTWCNLIGLSINCRFPIGSMSNYVLRSDSDVRNMLLQCYHMNEKIANGETVDYDILPHESTVHVSISSNAVHGNNIAQNPVNACSDKVAHDEEHNVPGSSNIGKSSSGCVSDSGGDSESFDLPSYDVCPVLKKRVLLSDQWSGIMDGAVGARFSGGAETFRSELIKYSTQMGFEFKYARNNQKYVIAMCSESVTQMCAWFIKASYHKATKCFKIYKANLVHNCVGQMVTRKTNRMSPTIIGSLLIQDVKSNPKMGGKGIIPLMKLGYGMDVPYWKAHRIIEDVNSKIHGSIAESYDELRWYCAAIIRTNPGSIAQVEKNEKTNRFERVFISFKACIDGFRCCHAMLFIDGTFMKGRAKGTLLSAISKDGDNGLFPVAFAVVSAENTDNWVWFLTKLRDNIKHEKEVVYLSDWNTGLMSAFPEVFEHPRHFFCVYHLMTNLTGRSRGGWNGVKRDNLVQMLKKCAYAPSRHTFGERVTIFIEAGGKKAEEWLAEIPYDKWALAYAPGIRRFGEVTSNTAESFNSWIRECRSYPIRIMIYLIRKTIGQLLVIRREKIKSWTGVLCPSKEDLWNKLVGFGEFWEMSMRSNGQFEVECDPSVTVDLSLQVFSCCRWNVTGFPCAHVVAVIRANATSIHNHVDECFFTTTYMECYSSPINSIPETEMIECQHIVDDDKILPPVLKNKPGKPKTKRKRSFGEFRKQKKFRCELCHMWGRHDKMTYPISLNEARAKVT